MNNFLAEYTEEHYNIIHNAEYIVWNLETTGLTATSTPVAVTKNTKIGDKEWLIYAKMHNSKLNCRTRIRISTILLPDGTILSWDLDALSAESRKKLLTDTINNKNLIGYNLTSNLTFAMSITGQWVKPELVYDVLLLIRCLKPSMTWAIHRLAALGCDDAISIVNSLKKTNAPATLEALSVGHGLGKTDKTYQKYANWCPTILTPEHYSYVTKNIRTPLLLISSMLQVQPDAFTNFNSIQKKINELDSKFNFVYGQIYRKVPVALAKISTRGLPLHIPTLNNIENHRMGLIPEVVDRLLIQIPALKPHEAALRSSQSGVSVEYKNILSEYAKDNGIILDIGKDGEPIISASSLTLKGANKLDGLITWSELQNYKEIVGLCSEYKLISAPTGSPDYKTLHALMGADAVTMRVTSRVPNVQNLIGSDPKFPDELQFRSAIRAKPGYSIVSSDFSQVELRIAAGLASRAINDIKKILKAEKGAPDWYIKAIKRGSDTDIELDQNLKDFNGISEGIAIAWRKVLQQGSVMSEAFRNNLDVHLLTGLDMSVKNGLIKIETTPLEHLKSLTPDEILALKALLKKERQGAKALNFGLLYGMQAAGIHTKGITTYGLDWTLEDAIKARDDWFDMYPEITVWHDFIKYVCMPPKTESRDMYVNDEYDNSCGKEKIKIGTSYTLAGRPVCAELSRKVINYSDQGSGADIMFDAIVNNLAEPYCNFVVNTVHDEIIMICPDSMIDSTKDALVNAMIQAQDSALHEYDIPSETDPDVCTYWRKKP